MAGESLEEVYRRGQKVSMAPKSGNEGATIYTIKTAEVSQNEMLFYRLMEIDGLFLHSSLKKVR